ncbi:MAG: hypothetical protein ACIAXF_07690 [Phycisphaerales bacterium JB063]
MDDPRTRQSIDDLAEHYLTGVKAPKPTPSIAPSNADPITGPPPIRLAPKPAVMHHVAQNAAALNAMANSNQPHTQRPAPQAIRTGGSNGNGTPGDGHPILRLADADTDQHEPTPPTEHLGAPTSPPPQRSPGRAQARPQAVVMGNLPGLSGPWLTQYAQRLAQTQGPVAIVHLDDDMIDLEVVEPRREANPQPSAPVSATRVPATQGSGLIALLDALVRSDETPVRNVLVRLSADAEAMSASRLAALDRWTVLCGSDDAAVVACYSMLKRVVEQDPRNAGKQVGLMVMGSDEDAAQRAVQKVASTASSFLSTPVEMVGHLRQMQPVTVRQMGSFADPVALWPQLVAWLDTLEDPADAPKTQHETPPQDARPNPLEPVINQPLTVPPPRRASAPSPQPAPAPPRQPEPMTTPRAAQPYTPGVSASPAGTPPVEDLFAMLAQGPAAIPGGLALDARVPTAPAIQLAVDEHGAVHLLMHHSQADDPRRAVPEMLDARRWVTEHRELLALTQRDRVFADTPPVLHLFTDRAEQATALVARLGDSLKLHLLQKVTLGRETGWFCTALN